MFIHTYIIPFLLLFKNLCGFALGKSKSAEKLFPTLFDYHTTAYYRNGLYVFVLAPQAGLEPATSWLTVMRSTDWAIEEYGIYDKSRRSPIFPRRHHLSIFGVYELNFCVRNGNRWNLIAICTGYHIFKVSNPENWIKEVIEKRNQKRWNKVKPSTD